MIEAVAQSWLGLLCRAIPGLRQAQLISGDGREPAARWPSGSGGTPGLAEAAQGAIEQGQAVVRGHAPRPSNPTGRSEIAVPFGLGDGRRGAVAVEVVHRRQWDSEPSCKSVVDLLHSASASLEVLAREASAKQRVVNVLEVHAKALELQDFGEAAIAVVTDLASRLGCERVSLGMLRGRNVQLRAISHSARFDERSRVGRDLQAAMEEATDQDATIVVPAPEGARARVRRAHEELLERHGAGTACSVPLAHAGEVVGAICFERRRGSVMDPATVRLCEDVALLLGPVLELKRSAEGRWLVRTHDFVRELLGKLRAPGHLEVKLTALAVVVAVLGLGFAKGEYRVAADATLEGRVQRAIVAGTEGFIAEANVRAGDVVGRGQVLGRLDDRDLQLQLRTVAGREAQVLKEYREARALGDRSQANILGAQIEQARAKAELLEEQLARTSLVAPFDGIVVEGDLSQSLGSPVERGDVLFKLAPLDGYRVILQVDERDIAHARPGQRGHLALSALPNQTLPLTVERVTPVAVAEEGSNYFRVEARLDETTNELRPGMEGVGKIGIEQRSYWWIWTHELTRWLRLWAWSWLP